VIQQGLKRFAHWFPAPHSLGSNVNDEDWVSETGRLSIKQDPGSFVIHTKALPLAWLRR